MIILYHISRFVSRSLITDSGKKAAYNCEKLHIT